MSEFCDVAVPVPLDAVFTYRVPDGMQPVVGGRVLVPFRSKRTPGIVMELHDRPPSVAAKSILRVLDAQPALDDQLLQLGKWIANYYLAPLGEVLRTMLPLGAEFKRTILYRITDAGQMALHLAGMAGSSGRARRTPEDQAAEFRVLDYLLEREATQESSLRNATRVSRPVLAGMVRKKWLEREDASEAREVARTVKVAELVGSGAAEPDSGDANGVSAHTIPSGTPLAGQASRARLNTNQRALMDALRAAGGRRPVEALQTLTVPRTTLSTLVKRGLVAIREEPADFHISHVRARPSPFHFEFNFAQKEALDKIVQGVAARKFAGMLMHGVTGSGKTAVYLAGMRAVLEAGRSAILLKLELDGYVSRLPGGLLQRMR